MIIGISGMIAAGKSSLSEKLHKYYKTSMMLHEFEEDDEVFNTFLKWLYENKPNLTIGFQSYIVENHSSKFAEILTKFESMKLDEIRDHIFLDRFSVEHYIFAKLITKSELPNFSIFLDISFDTFKKRIFQRGRESEINNFSENYEYFKNLHENYFKIFKEIAKRFKLKYYIIDTNNKTEEEVFLEAINIIDNEVRTKENEATNK